MNRTAFPLLVTCWALAGAMIMLANGHLPRLEPNGAALLSLIPVLGWLLGWLRSDAPALIASKVSGRWILSALGLVPVVMLGAMRFLGHEGHGPPGHDHPALPAEFLKAVFFCGPLLLLVFGPKPFANRRTPFMGEAPPAPAAGTAQRPRPRSSALVIAIGDVLRPVAWSKIQWLEADDNHVRVHTAGGDYFVRRSLQDLLADAGDDRFARIHKSWAVNRAEVAAIRPLANGDAEVRLRSGLDLRMSRRFRNLVF
jgi:hypothetical protein